MSQLLLDLQDVHMGVEMQNPDPIALIIMLKIFDFLLAQLGELLKEHREKRKHNRKSKSRRRH